MTPQNVVTIDFETHGIKPLPDYPPKPVGVAIKYPGRPGIYLAWGHPTKNNCTFEHAQKVLRAIWDSTYRVLFFSAKFDLAVALAHMGLPMLPWDRIDDAAIVQFLCDPHSKVNDLKGICEQLLNWPPEERDAVADWLWAHRRELVAKYGGKLTRAKKGENGTGAWLWAAPGDVVGRYAIGDVERTWELFDWLWAYVEQWQMENAYNRERQILPIFLENERDGMRIDLPALEADILTYQAAFAHTDAWLRWRLSAPGLSFNDDQAVAQALTDAGVVDADKWVETATGERSVSKDNLTPGMFNDLQVSQALGYRNRLETALKMFMLAWRDQAVRRGKPYVSTNWNLTRNPEGGTRTGRPSTNNPNFLNISKDFEGRPDGYTHPEFLGVPKLPLVRKYILPDEGHLFLHRDFNGQELRVYADFEQGKTFKAYLANPKIDIHQLIADEIKAMLPGTPLDRTKVKIINFRTIYGSGVPGLSKALMCSVADAKEFKKVHSKALPGMKDLNDEIKRVIGRGQPIRTWGDRIYFVEPAGYSKKHKKHMDYLYKLLNYLVQGSAADITKQALIDWYYHPRRDPRTRFLVTVYDEINISCPIDVWEEQMALLAEVMEAKRLEVPMLSDGKVGERWGELKKCA